jgi:hypothetical protein
MIFEDYESFMAYLAGERKDISKHLSDGWTKRTPKERVALENILLAFDQAKEELQIQIRVLELLKAGGIVTSEKICEAFLIAKSIKIKNCKVRYKWEIKQ